MKLALLLLVPVLLLSPGLSAQDAPLPFDAEIDALLERMEKGQRDERREAIDALFRRKDERIAGMVLGFLEETKEEEIIEDILRGIGRNEVVRGYEPAIARLSHKAAGVRSYAAVCLERLENEEAKKDLLKRAGSERDDLALKNALRALGKACPNRPDVASALLKRFTHKSSVVSANAVLSCAEFTEEGRVRSMVAGKIGAMLSRTSDIRVRSACLYSLGAVGTKDEIPDLEKFKKGFRNTMNPLAQAAIDAADIAIEKIRTGSTDEVSGGVFARLFDLASDDERDPARDGDPDKPVPPWLDMDPRKGGGRGGRGGR